MKSNRIFLSFAIQFFAFSIFSFWLLAGYMLDGGMPVEDMIYMAQNGASAFVGVVLIPAAIWSNGAFFRELIINKKVAFPLRAFRTGMIAALLILIVTVVTNALKNIQDLEVVASEISVLLFPIFGTAILLLFCECLTKSATCDSEQKPKRSTPFALLGLFVIFPMDSAVAQEFPVSTNVGVLPAGTAAPVAGTLFEHPWGISYKIPEGFKKLKEDATTLTYLGPKIGGQFLSMTFVKISMPGVPSELMYQGNATRYQDATQYQGFKEITTIPKAMAFQAEEIDKIKAEEKHNRLMFIWVPDLQFNIVISGSMSGIKASQALIDQFLASIQVK